MRDQFLSKLIIYISVFLLTIMLGATGRSQDIKESNNVDETQTKMLLTNKPVFLLEITKSGAPVKIDLNGMGVYSDRSRYQESVTYPLNDLIATGKNQLDIYAIAPKSLDYVLPEDAFVDVNFIVEDVSGNQYIIDQIIYRPAEADPFSGSSESGKYDLIGNELIKHNSGTIELGALNSSNLSMLYGYKTGGVKLTQSIELETPFPRWKFLDSEKVIEKDFLTMTTNEIAELKKMPIIQELYNANMKIHAGLESKDIASIIDLFDERSNEMDIAFYNPNNQTKSGFFRNLEREVNEKVELLEINYEKDGFFIEKNQTVAYVYQAIMFVYDDGSGSSKYPIKFRRENGKWVITR